MIKVTLTIEALIDPEEIGGVYTNEDFLLDEVKEHVLFGLDRLGIDEDNVTFLKTDVDGL